MNLYKVSRLERNINYGDYDKMIVAAEDEDTARRIYPGWFLGSEEQKTFILPQEFTVFTDCDEWLDEWIKDDISNLKVTLVGTTTLYDLPQVILASNVSY